MAVVQTKSGDLPISIGGSADVYGDNAAQIITIQDTSNIVFRSGFNSGARDTIVLTGLAQNFDFSVVNGSVVLTSAVDGITIRLPVGSNGTNITFDNGDSRVLSVSGTGAGTTYSLGSQSIVPANNPGPVDVTPGPGVYSVTGNPQQLEGTAYIFTVTRTDTSVANEQLTFNVQGNTKGGTVTAADPGADFTAAGNTVTFAGNSATATFTVNLNLDSDVEGLEGILAQVFKDGNVVGSTIGLIEDANKVGQTFTLTPGIDTVGSGSQTDLKGSEGSTSVIGQDTIIVTENTANVFDNIDGGAEIDTLRILDAGTFLTAAPNFTNIKVQNVENVTYTSVRGLNGAAIDTSGWTGLQNFSAQVDTGADQTFKFSTETKSIALTNVDDGDITVVGGAGVLTVNAQTPGDVFVGTTGGDDNAFTDVFVNGGDDLTINDTGSGLLTNVQINGNNDDATITGANIATVGITNLVGGDRLFNINANNPTINISNIAVTALDVNASGAATFNIGNNVVGLDDLNSDDGPLTTVNYNGAGNVTFGDLNVTDSNFDNPAVATITNNSSNGGSLTFDDINGDAPSSGSNDLRTINLNATKGSITLDDIIGSNWGGFDGPIAVNVTGAGAVFFDTVTGIGTGGTVITRTDGGNTTIGNLVGNGPYRTALSTLTKFDGSADTGSDTMTFAAGNQRANTFGAGDDNVAVLGALGVGGSLDGGVGGLDKLFAEANVLASWTQTKTATSNFNELVITHQVAGTDDVIALNNIGFEGATTNVTSGVGPGVATKELTTITITGESTWTDTVKFSGQFAGLTDIVLADKTSASDIATAIASKIDGSPLYSASAAGGVITITAENGGPIVDIKAGDISFLDADTFGAPALEAGSPSYVLGDDTGAVAVTGVKEVQTLVLTDVTLDAGQSITFTWDPDGPGGFFAARTFTYTNTTGNPQTQNGGFLADAIVAQANAAQAGASTWEDVWVATRVGNNVVFTADSAPLFDENGDRPAIVVSGSLTGGDIYSLVETTKGVTEVDADFEVFRIRFDGNTTGNDTVTFDGVTVTFNNAADPNAMATQFAAQYNLATTTALGGTRDWQASVINVRGAFFVQFDALVAEPRTNIVSGDFVFFDDNNDGTPLASNPVILPQGTNGSITLNEWKNASTLTLTSAAAIVDGTGLGATHIVNLAAGTDTSSDTFNLVLAADGNHGTVQANLFENVAILTSGQVSGGTDTLVFNDTAAKSVIVSGSDGLTLDTNSTVISNLDASGLGTAAFFTWTADANTVAITIKTGAGGSDVDVSAIHLPNATAGVLANPIQFIGGSGNDELQLGTDLGSARANITWAAVWT